MKMTKKSIKIFIILILICIVLVKIISSLFTSIYNHYSVGDKIPLGVEWTAEEYDLYLKTNPREPGTPPYGYFIIDNQKIEFEFLTIRRQVTFFNKELTDIYINACYTVDENQNIIIDEISYVSDYSWDVTIKKIILKPEGDK